MYSHVQFLDTIKIHANLAYYQYFIVVNDALANNGMLFECYLAAIYCHNC